MEIALPGSARCRVSGSIRTAGSTHDHLRSHPSTIHAARSSFLVAPDVDRQLRKREPVLRWRSTSFLSVNRWWGPADLPCGVRRREGNSRSLRFRSPAFRLDCRDSQRKLSANAMTSFRVGAANVKAGISSRYHRVAAPHRCIPQKIRRPLHLAGWTCHAISGVSP